ncbi:MAG TPA: glycosyltransferase [Micromonospora sp.]
MSGPRASVIVPVYNTSRWLPEALTSIDQQSCRDELEVVIVDDGSTDDSNRIARDYAAKAPNVRFVRQENAGLGAARNHGLRLATGRHLAFLDSDDLYPPGALDELLTLADTHHAPVVVGDMQGLPPRPNPPWCRELITGERVIDSLEQAPDLVGNPSACNKVYRRDFVDSTGVTFTEGTAFEDVLFTLPLLVRAERIVLTPRLAYLYRTRGDGSSIMDARSQPAKIFQHLTIIEKLAAAVADTPDGVRQAVNRWIAYMQLHYAWRAASALDDGQLAEFTARMSALFKEIPVDVASEFVSNLGGGLRALAIYEQDPVTVRTPAFAGPLLIRSGQVYAGHPLFDRYRELLRVRSLTVDFTRLTGGPRSAVEGVLHFPAGSAAAGDVRDDLLLEAGDGLVRRPLTIRRARRNRLDWSCELPLHGLDAGAHRLRVVVRDNGREYAVPISDSRRTTRAVALADGRTGWLDISPASQQLVISGSPLGPALHTPVWLANVAYRRGRTATGAGRRKLKQAARRVLRRS